MIDFSTYENRMKESISRMSYALEMTEDPEQRRDILTTTYKELVEDGSYLVEELTGNKNPLRGCEDTIRDSLSEAFELLINDQEDEEDEQAQRMEPYEIAASLADDKRDYYRDAAE